MKQYLFIFIFIVLYSCGNRNVNIYESFDSNEKITHKIGYDNSKYLMGLPGKMAVIDSLLTIIDYKSENLFHIFDINTNNYLGNYGSKGSGPNEFLHPYSIDYNSSNSFLMYDASNFTLYKVYLDSIAQGKLYSEVDFHSSTFGDVYVLPTKFSTYVSFGLYKTNMFKIMDSKDENIGYFCDFPLEDEVASKTIDNRNLALAYQGKMISNSKNDKFAYISFYATIVGFYDVYVDRIENNKLYAYDYPNFSINNDGGSFSSPINKDGICAFLDLYGTEKYVYTLYSGQIISQSKEEAFRGKDVFVYDWEGNPAMHYVLDIPISSIAITKDNKKMFAIAYNPEPELVMFDLSL